MAKDREKDWQFYNIVVTLQLLIQTNKTGDMSIAENIKHYQSSLPSNVKLIAVSKTKPVEDLQQAYDAGQRLFGENKALEMRDKHEVLPKDIHWHFIGHLQTNKVKYIVPFVSMIHSVDSLKVLKEINKEAIKCGRVVDCLLQIDIAHEETKFGMSEEELAELLEGKELAALANVRLCGLMGIGSITDSEDKTREEFHHLKEVFDSVKERFFADKDWFCELSMGMSHDYALAIEQGSTMVRIGSSIFGLRDYSSKN